MIPRDLAKAGHRPVTVPQGASRRELAADLQVVWGRPGGVASDILCPNALPCPARPPADHRPEHPQSATLRGFLVGGGVQVSESIGREQARRVAEGGGFIAALDQSGGSTPKALRLYGVDESAYANDSEMYDVVHAMRTRIVTNPRFDGARVRGAILFQNTVDREVEGLPTSEYLWRRKGIVPFLKVDHGLADEQDGVQRMKPIPDLDDRLPAARAKAVFGTKMRSVIKAANAAGIAAVVEQQFAFAEAILGHDLVPIIEPEVDIHAPDKAACEGLLRERLHAGLHALRGDGQVMFKLTLPEEAGYYAAFCAHPKVLRVVALSGGYSRAEANRKLEANPGVIASFSRALTEGLRVDQDAAAFTAQLDDAVAGIAAASAT